MKIEDIAKAFYFLNVANYKNSLSIREIEFNRVWFSNHKSISISKLVEYYDNYIKTGEIAELRYDNWLYV